MAIIGKKINVEDLKFGDFFKFENSKQATCFENAIYAQARKKNMQRPIFGWGTLTLRGKVFHTLRVVDFKTIKTRVK